MKLPVNQFVLLFLLMLSVGKGFSCVMPQKAYKVFDDKNISNNFVQGDKSIEYFLNEKYGTNNWGYDDNNFKLTIPEKNHGLPDFPFKVSYGIDPVSEGTGKIILYVKEKIRVIDEYNSSSGANKNIFTSITKIGEFIFRERALPSIKSRFSFKMPTEVLSVIGVYVPSNSDDKVKVTRKDNYLNYNGNCVFTYYVKGDNELLDNYGLQRYYFTGRRYLSPNEEIPTNKFKVIYFDRHSSKQRFYKEYTDDIVMDKVGSYKDIYISDMGAYYVGRFVVEEDSTLQYDIRFYDSVVRFIIDGRIIYEKFPGGSEDATINVDLEKGVHKIEVEFRSDHFSPNFSITRTE